MTKTLSEISIDLSNFPYDQIPANCILLFRAKEMTEEGKVKFAEEFRKKLHASTNPDSVKIVFMGNEVNVFCITEEDLGILGYYKKHEDAWTRIS